ncbi:prolyl oligopeptidase family serine peptidase [Blautia sp. An46]|uniref:prolyl oligopeptidase family serine peptidase n=1 Tax=Blautia sp. An46 TaxID=1965636 RepID=UPI001FA835B9|nr:prolyl oligopeptidase family serine peptidase [Blautia sp. An46]
MKEKIMAFFMAGILLFMGGCGTMENRDTENNTETGSETTSALAGDSEETSRTEDSQESASGTEEKGDYVTEGTEEYRGFTLDNVLHSETQGDIHFNLYVPDSYDGEEPCAVFFTLPGYERLYFQGVGENLYSENFGFEAQAYDPDMIIVAPQLSDWGETSADQTIALVEYFLANYNIDLDRVYGEGYSGGGETMSQVMGKRPELFAAYLQCSSQWDGDYEPVIESRTPVYFVIGESDEYYGSQPTQEAYDNLYELYRQEGLSDEEINQLLVLDIKDADYFESQGVTVQHGGGNLFAQDEEIMGWLFSKQREN